MTTYKFCTCYNAGKKKLHRVSVSSCSQSLQAFLLLTSLHTFLLFKQSFLKRHGAAFTQNTGPQCAKWYTRNVSRALMAGPLASLVLKYHTETAFCRGSTSYFPKDKVLWPGICTNDARWSYRFNKYFVCHYRRRRADLLAHTGQGAQHSTEFNPCVKVERKRASGSARRAICKPPLCNIQYNRLGRLGSVSARWQKRKTRTGTKCHK